MTGKVKRMLRRRKAVAALIATLLGTQGNCTPLIVGRSGHHIFIATNSIDTQGNIRCKLHFAKHAVVMWATQASSMTMKWPTGRTETVDFEASLNDQLRESDEPIDTLKEMLVQNAEERIRSILQLYKETDPDRGDVARDLVSEYVIVGRERDGFLGVRAFTLEVDNPQSITFEVQDITSKLHDGEVIDYTEGEVNVGHARGVKAVRAAVYARLQQHSEEALRFGNKAFSPPYLVMDITRSGRSYLSDPGPCGS